MKDRKEGRRPWDINLISARQALIAESADRRPYIVYKPVKDHTGSTAYVHIHCLFKQSPCRPFHLMLHSRFTLAVSCTRSLHHVSVLGRHQSVLSLSHARTKRNFSSNNALFSRSRQEILNEYKETCANSRPVKQSFTD